jgi:hypothetical protein
MCLELVSDESNSTSIITERQLSAMRNTNVSGWLPANQATITYLGEFHPYISAVFSFFCAAYLRRTQRQIPHDKMYK